MRESIAAIALVRWERDGETRWLSQWNLKWQRYNLVGGHKRHDETFRECVVREIEEELDLLDGRDLCVAVEPYRHVEYMAYSVRAQQETRYTIELFEVDELDESAHRKVGADPKNRWLTEGEIRASCTSDGILVSETIVHLLGEAELLPVAD